MSWDHIFQRMRQPKRIQLNWGCSICKRRFAKRENIRCHVTRNLRCSTGGAKEVWLGDAVAKIKQVKSENLVQENDHSVDQIPQRPRPQRRKRIGVRPFPPALIARVAKEGKELAETNGRRKTVRILLEKYAMAKLSATSVDRWVFELSDEKLLSFIKLARQKGARLRLPANLKEMSKSRISRPDLVSEVYVQYRHRRDQLKLRISFS